MGEHEDWSIEDTEVGKLRATKGQAGRRTDPYDGVFANKPPSRKRDLRKVQEWLEAKRRAETVRQENEVVESDPSPGHPRPGKK